MFRSTPAMLTAALALVFSGRFAHADLKDFTDQCEKAGVHLPGILPVQDHCKEGDKTKCNNWKILGEFEATDTEASSALVVGGPPAIQTQGKARLYEWPETRDKNDKTTTICWYLFRGARAKDSHHDQGNLGNGTLCFNTKNNECKVCALDADVLKPKWSNLKGADELNNTLIAAQNCWQCHAAGTVAPKAVGENFFNVAKKAAMPATNAKCAKNTFKGTDGTKQHGPEWIGASKDLLSPGPASALLPAKDTKIGWQNDATWGKSQYIPRTDLPKACESCHAAGFIQTRFTIEQGEKGKPPKKAETAGTPQFCRYIANPAFHAGGSMVGPSKKWSGKDCSAFAANMGCEPAQFGCVCNKIDSDDDCKDKLAGPGILIGKKCAGGTGLMCQRTDFGTDKCECK